MTEEEAKRDSPIDKVISMRECMKIFDIKDSKTVLMAILTGRVIGRKMDKEVGEYGGTFIIDFDSAYAKWGHRLNKETKS